jgi:hypothetical protein
VVSDKAIRQGIYEKLNTASVTSLLAEGSASIRHAVAPPSGRFPYIIFSKVSGVPVQRFGGNAYDNHIWLVKAVARDTSSSTAEDISKAVDDLLDFGTLTISGGTLLHLARESDVDYIEVVGDQQYRHHGANYRLAVAT